MIPHLIASENVPIAWTLVVNKLQKAMDKLETTEYDTEYVYGLLVNQQAQLWMESTNKMFAITRLIQYPTIKRLVVDFIVGEDVSKYYKHLEFIEHWAAARGATQAEAEVRPGLQKILRNLAWNRKRITMYKTLHRGLH